VLAELVFVELQAASSADAAAVALNRPAPLSSRRREGPSFIFRVSIASSTTGSIFFIRTSMDLFPWNGLSSGPLAITGEAVLTELAARLARR
jgi:hypothetical protein